MLPSPTSFPAEGRASARLAGGCVIEAPDAPGTRRVPRWAPPLAWAALVFAASSLPDLQTRVMGLQVRDKLAHFGEYFVFGWLVARSFDGLGWRPGKHFLWTVLCGALLGVLDEFYQGFVPGRERDALDLAADVCGALAGWYFSREDETVGSPRSPGNA
jgi:VanZ family protein